MKLLLLAGLFFVFLMGVDAQNLTYAVLIDDPDQANTSFIAPEFGMESNSTDLSIFVGANLRRSLGGLALEGIGRYDVWKINGTSAAFFLEGGIYLPMNTKNKNKEVPVFLSYNPYAGKKYENGKEYNIEETKYIKIPSGKYKNTYGLRGGVHLRRVGVSDDLSGDVDPGNIILGGIYLGGQFTSQAFVKTLINNDVERIGAGFSRIYGDLLVFPISQLSDERLTAEAKSDGIIGWRIGYQWYISPHEGEYKFFGNSVFGAEIGNRPLSGFMFNVTWGWALFRGK